MIFTTASWLLNSSASFLSSRLVSRAELLSMENIYSADIDGDGGVGLLFTSFGAKLNNVEVGVTQLGYAIRNNGGGPILISWSQGYASQNNPGGGWVGIAARSTNTGYELFWKNNISGQFAVWVLRSDGFLLSGRLLSLSEMLALETKYGVKIR